MTLASCLSPRGTRSFALSPGVFAVGGGVDSFRSGVWPMSSPLMNVIRSSISIALTCPSKLGMMGRNPATIFASGRRIDSRRYASSAITVLPSSSVTGRMNSFSSSGARAFDSRLWQVMHCSSRKSCRPRVAAELSEFAVSQSWKAAGSMTVIQPTIRECSVPQYSPQKR